MQFLKEASNSVLQVVVQCSGGDTSVSGGLKNKKIKKFCSLFSSVATKKDGRRLTLINYNSQLVAVARGIKFQSIQLP